MEIDGQLPPTRQLQAETGTGVGADVGCGGGGGGGAADVADVRVGQAESYETF